MPRWPTDDAEGAEWEIEEEPAWQIVLSSAVCALRQRGERAIAAQVAHLLSAIAR